MDKNKLIKIEVGDTSYPTNCYIIYDENRQGIVIDPGYDKDKTIKVISDNNIEIKYVILTHCHADHLGALEDILNHTKAKVLIHKNDTKGIFDDDKAYYSRLNVEKQNIDKNSILTLEDNQIIKLGNISLEIIHTPGHTDGCICILEKGLNVLFTGDTIFHNCYGRCDLKTGSIVEMKKSINKLFDRFNDITIYPGHEKECNIDSCKRKINMLLSMRGE